jgi:BirA family biotin operon repressor/biotin-[acetyl-CoA-carboxylase] ligase
MEFKNFIIEEYDTLESTNKLAFELALNNKINERHVITAKVQSKGRGRYDRIWESKAGNLYFSLLLRPKISIEKIPHFSLLAINALHLAVKKMIADYGINLPQITLQNKWPNDLLLNGKKIAGMLLESSVNQQRVEFIIIGIGLNLNCHPAIARFAADNLKNFNVNINRKEALEIFLEQFDELYASYLTYGFAALRNLWLKSAYKLKEEISVGRDEKSKIKGIFDDLNKDGNLILQIDGKKIMINAGEI